MEKIVLKVEGMSCAHCEAAVERALTALEGVASVSASAKKGETKVKFDASKVSADTLRAAVVEAGYRSV